MLIYLTSNDIEKYENIVLLPLASIEDHGKLPLGTDSIILEHILARITEETKSLIVAPPLYYGFSVEHSLSKYTIYLTGQEFINILKHVLLQLSRTFKGIIMLTTHGGNIWPAYVAAREVKASRKTKIIIINFWELVKEYLVKVFHLDYTPLHADPIETSLLTYCTPSIIKRCDIEVIKKEEFIERLRRRENSRNDDWILTPWTSEDHEYIYHGRLYANIDIGGEIFNYSIMKIREAIENFKKLLTLQI